MDRWMHLAIGKKPQEQTPALLLHEHPRRHPLKPWETRGKHGKHEQQPFPPMKTGNPVETSDSNPFLRVLESSLQLVRLSCRFEVGE
jgi:hypothetical protein